MWQPAPTVHPFPTATLGPTSERHSNVLWSPTDRAWTTANIVVQNSCGLVALRVCVLINVFHITMQAIWNQLFYDNDTTLLYYLTISLSTDFVSQCLNKFRFYDSHNNHNNTIGPYCSLYPTIIFLYMTNLLQLQKHCDCQWSAAPQSCNIGDDY